MSTELEDQLERALHRIAVAHVPDEPTAPDSMRPRKPWAMITLVAAAVVTAAGLGVIVSSTRDAAPTTDLLVPIATSAADHDNQQQPNPTTDTDTDVDPDTDTDTDTTVSTDDLVVEPDSDGAPGSDTTGDPDADTTPDPDSGSMGDPDSASTEPADPALDERTDSVVSSLLDDRTRPIVVLIDDVAPEPGVVTPETERWLFSTDRGATISAVRRVPGGEIENVISWDSVPGRESDWDKTFWDQPDVTLADGRSVKRLVPTITGSVVYAIQLDDGRVFTASTEAGFEDEFATWFSSLGPAPADVEPPVPYTEVATPLESENVRYPSIGGQLTITTTRFAPGDDFDVETRARISGGVERVESVAGSGATIVYPKQHPQPEFTSKPWVSLEVRPDLQVTLGGADLDTLIDLLPSLRIVPFADADVVDRELRPPVGPNSDVEFQILGEVSLGRVVVSEYVDGHVTCRAVETNFSGGGPSCRPTSDLSSLDSEFRLCSSASGSYVPGEENVFEYLATMIVPSGEADATELRIDGEPIPTTIDPIIGFGDGTAADTGLVMISGQRVSDGPGDVEYLDDGRPADCWY